MMVSEWYFRRCTQLRQSNQQKPTAMNRVATFNLVLTISIIMAGFSQVVTASPESGADFKNGVKAHEEDIQNENQELDAMICERERKQLQERSKH